MVDYPILRFVSDVGETDPRLDLNAAPFSVDAEGFSLGAPSLETEPLAVGQPYGWRTVSANLSITGGGSVAAGALTSLSVELQRRVNWLMWQFDADSEPMWLRTFASDPQPLDFETVYVDRNTSRWAVPLEVTADAFIRGAEVDLGWSHQIRNDPTATNGMVLELPTIEGDAETPLTIRFRASNEANLVYFTWLVALSHLAPECTYGFSSPITVIPADMTLSSGHPQMELKNNDQALGGQYWRVFDVPTDWKPVLRDNNDVQVPVGRYKVLARLRSNAISGGENVVAFSVGGLYHIGDGTRRHDWQPQHRITLPADFGWHDLGEITLPAGAESDDPNLTGQRNFGIRLRRLSGGTDTLIDIAGFVLIPVAGSEAVVDSRILKAYQGDAVIEPDSVIRFDGDRKRIERTPQNRPMPRTIAGGGYPTVRPGHRNILHMTGELQDLGAQPVDGLHRRFDIRLSYYPRFLHPMRPADDE